MRILGFSSLFWLAVNSQKAILKILSDKINCFLGISIAQPNVWENFPDFCTQLKICTPRKNLNILKFIFSYLACSPNWLNLPVDGPNLATSQKKLTKKTLGCSYRLLAMSNFSSDGKIWRLGGTCMRKLLWCLKPNDHVLIWICVI